MVDNERYLTKSLIASYEQCPKKLWLSFHRRDLAKIDDSTQRRMYEGQYLGKIARSLEPSGILVDIGANMDAAVTKTAELIADGWRNPIFEATFKSNDVVVRVDVLRPLGASGWVVSEVKSSTKVKPYHLNDLATQTWVAANTGVEIASSAISHVDNSFVLKQIDSFEGLLTTVDVSAKITDIIGRRPDHVGEAFSVIDGNEPEIEIGAHCSKPFECEFKSYCVQISGEGPDWPVSILPGVAGKRVAAELKDQGVFDLTNAPADALNNEVQKRIYTATKTDTPYVDRNAIAEAFEKWPFPRYFLDFETIAFAIPQWIGTRPYQQIPFQFSCHIQDESGELSHFDFLSTENIDPRKACVEALLAAIGDEGAVIAYSASFERSVVNDLAAAFDDWSETLADIASRIVDLLPVVKNHYYHRNQRGSWSIKAVLPTLAPEMAYDTLEVKSGDAAQSAFLEMTDENTDADRKKAIQDALITYCERDTLAMVKVMEKLTDG